MDSIASRRRIVRAHQSIQVDDQHGPGRVVGDARRGAQIPSVVPAVSRPDDFFEAANVSHEAFRSLFTLEEPSRSAQALAGFHDFRECPLARGLALATPRPWTRYGWTRGMARDSRNCASACSQISTSWFGGCPRSSQSAYAKRSISS
jgi:hypothetical protein